MPAWWTPDITYWLLPAALVGVPVIAGAVFVVAGFSLGIGAGLRRAQPGDLAQQKSP